MISFEFSNYHTEERSEAELFCAVLKQNGDIIYPITEQNTISYDLAILEHSHIQNNVMACAVL